MISGVGMVEVRSVAACLAICTAMGGMAFADERVPQGVERDRMAEIVDRVDAAAAQTGAPDIDRTLSRVQSVGRPETALRNTEALHASSPMRDRRAMTDRSKIHARLSSDATATNRERDATLPFSVSPRGQPWRDYEIIMWQKQAAQQYASLRKIGVTAGAVLLEDKEHPDRLPQTQLEALQRNGLRCYIENIATDFYSAYHRWWPDHPVNWHFQEPKQLYQRNPLDPAALIRVPSLSDPEWLRRIGARLERVVRATGACRPLFYNLADEPGIGDLSIFWDFDFSEPSLAGFRTWLRQQYGTLAALNRQWHSHFGRWTAVRPMTTREAMARSDGNYSAWADFKEWMDEAFARAVRSGTGAVHKARRGSLAAVEGGQIPGWGGYDYSRLGRAVDAMELYDGGGNLEILHSLNPRVVILTTSSGSGALEAHHTWRELLRGAGGLILWDPNSDFVHADGTLGYRAQEVMGYFGEIRSGLGALLINSTQRSDSIAILYSPASMRTQWLLDWKPKGDAWSKRDIEASYEDANPVRSSMVAYSDLLDHWGLHPSFLTSELITRGELESGRYRILILPRTISLGVREVKEIERFVRRGGVAIADGEPGIFDNHGRWFERAALPDLFPRPSDAATAVRKAGKGKAVHVVRDVGTCVGQWAADPCKEMAQELARLFQERDIKPAIAIRAQNDEAVSDIERYTYRNGGVTIIGLQRDLPEKAGTQDWRGDDSRERIILALPRGSFVYDLRDRRALGQTDRVNITLNSVEPTVLAMSPKPLPHLLVRGPAQVRAGETAEFHFSYAGASVASIHVLHIGVVDPSGESVMRYSANVTTVRGTASLQVRIDRNEPLGTWTLGVTDLPSTETISVPLNVVRD